ncbi:MAG: protein kinase [Polyangia bacterium]
MIPIEGHYQFLGIVRRVHGEVTILVKDQRTDQQRRLVFMIADWARESTVREAMLSRWQALSALQHPNLLQVFDAGITRQDYLLIPGLPRIRRGTLFVVTEICLGHDLATHLGKGALPPGFVADVCEQAGAALLAGAERGLYHLSLHPESIFCSINEDVSTAPASVKLLDLGLASVVRGELQHHAWLLAMRSGLVYMAPELLAAESGLHTAGLAACDQYALAAVTYQLLCGHPPFGLNGEAHEGIKNFIEEVQRARVLPLPSACGPGVSEVLLRALSKRPEQRYPSVAEFTAALRLALTRSEARPLGARRSTMAWTFLLAGSLFVALTAVPFLLSGPDGRTPAPPDLRKQVDQSADLTTPPAPPPPASDLSGPAVLPPAPVDLARPEPAVVPPPSDLAVPRLAVADLATRPPDAKPAEDLEQAEQAGKHEKLTGPNTATDQALRCSPGQMTLDMPDINPGLAYKIRVCVGKGYQLRKFFPIVLAAPRDGALMVARNALGSVDELNKKTTNFCIKNMLENQATTADDSAKIPSGTEIVVKCNVK